MTAYPLCPSQTLAEGSNRGFEIAGRPVLLCRSGGRLYAVANRCTHQLEPLEGGRMRGPHLFCPLHGARFDMRDGSTAGELTKTPIATYPVAESEDGTITVELPE